MNLRTSSSTAALIAAAIAAISSARPAAAQAGPASSAPTQPNAKSDDARAVQDIIVTASRRPETLQRTAIPVAAISGAEIAERGVTNVKELTKLTPALKIGELGGGQFQITARGVGTFGGNTFAEPGVSVNLDGVYIPRTGGANGIFYDVQRVELLKGPQGTLYGRNTTGGVLNIFTNDPTSQLGGNVTVEAGNYGLKRASGALNVPIAEGVAFRIAGQGIDRDGYFNDGYGDDKGYAGRAKLKLVPTSRLSILLEANYTRVKGRGGASVFSPFVDPGNPYVGPTDPRSNALFNIPGIGPLLPRIGSDGFVDNSQRGLQGSADYDLGAMKASLIVNNNRTTSHYLFYTNGFPVREDTRATPLYYSTAEFRLASQGSGPFKWVVGTYYFQDKNITNAAVDQGTTYADTHGLTLRTKSYSGFGEATYTILPHVRLTAGGRYTSDKKSIFGTVVNPPAPCFPPAVSGVDPIRGAACISTDSGQTTFSKFTYKLGADADIAPNSLLYANYATGFKSGGFFASTNSAPAGSFPTNAYRPETISAWTLGSKNRFFNNSLQVNIEGFYWKYKDKQVSHLGFVPPANVILLVDNAGSATTYGAEANIAWRPTRHDDLSVNVQYQHSRYDNFSYNAVIPAYAQPFRPGTPVPGPVTGCAFSATTGIGGAPRGAGVPGQSTINCTGNQLSLAPKWTASVSYRHTFVLPDGTIIVPSASTNISSGFWLGEEYYTGEYQTSYITGDAAISITPRGKGLTATFYINNIGNRAVGSAAFLQATLGKALEFLRPPRTYGVRASVNF